MWMACGTRQRTNIYRDKPRPRWQRCLVYALGCIVLVILAWCTLRDTTPVRFVEPTSEDFNAPPGEHATTVQLEDVYWRNAMRHAGNRLQEICQTKKYSVLTHKSIIMDGERMRESYIYLCNPISDIVSIINARKVISAAAKETVSCIETYGNVTKTITRKYPFSLKYIDGQSFVQRTRVVRDEMEVCIWLHAIDIVESVWD